MSKDKDSKNSLTGSKTILRADKHPGAAAVLETLKEAKSNGTYNKGKPRSGPTSFKPGDDRPKRLTLVEQFADKVGVVRGDRIFTKMLDAAEEGEMSAMVFILERLFPKGKISRTMYTSIHDLITLGDIDEAQTQIIREIAAGEMDIDDGEVLFNMTVKKSEYQVRQATEEMKELLAEVKEAKGVK